MKKGNSEFNVSQKTYKNKSFINWIYLVWGGILIIYSLFLFYKYTRVNLAISYLVILPFITLVLGIGFIIRFKHKTKLILLSFILSIIPSALYFILYLLDKLGRGLNSIGIPDDGTLIFVIGLLLIPIYMISIIIAIILIVIDYIKQRN